MSFDATRISSNDVDYPIDTVVLENDSFKLREHRFEEKDLGHISEFWNERLTAGIEELPVQVLDQALKDPDDASLLRKSS